MIKKLFVVPVLAGLAASLVTGCESAQSAVSYSEDVQPILAKHCLSCHVPGKSGYEASGLNMESYDALLQGTRFGPVVKPGDSFTSALVMLVEGRADPSIKMPHGAEEELSEAEITTLKQWVDQGAKNN